MFYSRFNELPKLLTSNPLLNNLKRYKFLRFRYFMQGLVTELCKIIKINRTFFMITASICRIKRLTEIQATLLGTIFTSNQFSNFLKLLLLSEFYLHWEETRRKSILFVQ